MTRSVTRRPARVAPLEAGEGGRARGLEPEPDSRSAEVARVRRDSATTVVLVLTPDGDRRPHRVSCHTDAVSG